jgi:hypothetical protein
LSGRLSWWDVAKYQCGLAIQDYFHRKNDFVSAKGMNNAHRTYFNVGRQQRHWRA